MSDKESLRVDFTKQKQAIKLQSPADNNFLWMGFNCLKAEPLRGGSLLFTTNSNPKMVWQIHCKK